jgi:hypothetical protein
VLQGIADTYTQAQADSRYVNSSTGVITETVASEVPLTVKGATAQTADLLRVQNSTSANLVSVNKDGYILTPTRPAFRYHGFSLVAAGMQGGSAPLNIGNHLSIFGTLSATYSRFTAPVNGLYVIGFSCLIEISTGRAEIEIRKNGSGTIDGYPFYSGNNDAGQYTTAGNQFILYLSANDTITLHLTLGTLHANLTRGDRQFWGYLVG